VLFSQVTLFRLQFGLGIFAVTGISMGHAPDQVKAAADFVTDTNNNHGLAKALAKFIYRWLYYPIFISSNSYPLIKKPFRRRV
jgi:hypothetical protein